MLVLVLVVVIDVVVVIKKKRGGVLVEIKPDSGQHILCRIHVSVLFMFLDIYWLCFLYIFVYWLLCLVVRQLSITSDHLSLN